MLNRALYYSCLPVSKFESDEVDDDAGEDDDDDETVEGVSAAIDIGWAG